MCSALSQSKYIIVSTMAPSLCLACFFSCLFLRNSGPTYFFFYVGIIFKAIFTLFLDWFCGILQQRFQTSPLLFFSLFVLSLSMYQANVVYTSGLLVFRTDYWTWAALLRLLHVLSKRTRFLSACVNALVCLTNDEILVKIWRFTASSHWMMLVLSCWEKQHYHLPAYQT